MFFLKTAYLWGLLAISIPIIIHFFFRIKLKPTYFPSLRFLKLSYKRKRLSLKLHQILLLLLRIALITSLFLFLAEPFIWREATSRQKTAGIIFLDTSFSTSASYKEKKILTLLRKKLLEKTSRLSFFYLVDTARGDILTFDSLSSLTSYLSQLQPAYTGLSDDLFLKLKNVFQSKDISAAFIFSDFQTTDKKYWENLYNILSSYITSENIRFFSFIEDKIQKLPNLFIEKVEVENGYFPLIEGNTYQIKVAIANHLSEPLINIPVRISVNGSKPLVKHVSLPPQTTTSFKMPHRFSKADFYRIKVALELPSHYAKKDSFSGDNIKYLVVPLLAKPEVLIVYGKEEKYSYEQDDFYLRNAISPSEESNIKILRKNFKEAEKLDFKNFDLIYFINIPYFSTSLQQKVEEFLKAGKNIVIMPGENSEFAYYHTQFIPGVFNPKPIVASDEDLQLEISKFFPQEKSLLPFKDAGFKKYFSSIKFFKLFQFKIDSSLQPFTRIILGIDTKLPYLISFKPPTFKGKTFIFTSPPSPQWSNFCLTNTFPVFFNYFTFLYSGHLLNLETFNTTTTSNLTLPLLNNSNDKRWEVITPDGKKYSLASVKDTLNFNNTSTPGFYKFNSSSQTLWVAINPPGEESQLKYFIPQFQNTNSQQTFSSKIKIKQSYQEFFIYLLAILFLGETLLLKRFTTDD